MKTKYLVVGNGRLSKHLQHYFSLLDLPFKIWTRQQSQETLTASIAWADRVCLAVRDDALVDFISQNPELRNKTTIHFSGSQNAPGAFTAHPLMTFGPDLYSREIYLNMPFITVEGEPDLRELLPEFMNPSAKIPGDKKALYHAFCVMSGNFTTLLWQNVMRDFDKELHIPKQLLEPYLKQITSNLITNSNGALTGPIARGDLRTIEQNLHAIRGTPYENIYEAFLAARPL